MTQPKPKVVPNLSPTTYNKFQRCPRIVWYEKVDGRKTPKKDNLIIGGAAHTVCEKYLLTGEWVEKTAAGVDCTRIAKAGKDYLDDLRTLMSLHPGSCHVELATHLPADSGLGPLPVKCFADFVGPDLVVDHKTTSKLNGPWHKTQDELALDPQMLWYAYLSLRGDPPDEFNVRHIYYATKGRPASRVLTAPTTWEAAIANRDKFVAASHEILALTSITRAEDVRGNPDACSDFGGCPHSPYCPVKKHITRGSPMSFRDKIKKMREAKAAAEQPPTPPETPAHVPSLGQMNPPDTPGSETPTAAQYAEVATAAMDAAGHGATDEALAGWLGSPAGVDALLRAGLTLRDVGNVVAYVNDDFTPPEGQVDPPAGAPESSPPAPADTSQDSVEPPDASGPPSPPPAPAPEAPTDEIQGLLVRFTKFLLGTGGPASKKDLVPIVREVLGKKRIGHKIWGEQVYGPNGVLALGRSRGVWDYSANDAAVVWLTEGLPPEAGTGTSTTPAETESAPAPASQEPEVAQDEPVQVVTDAMGGRHERVRVIAEHKHGVVLDATGGRTRFVDVDGVELDKAALREWLGAGPEPVLFGHPRIDNANTTPARPSSTALIILVGCLPEQTAATTRLDSVLEPFYAAVAKDEGQPDYALVEYGKGPLLVAAEAKAAVREGRMPVVKGFLTVPADHPMVKHVGRIWPDAIVIRGVR